MSRFSVDCRNVVDGKYIDGLNKLYSIDCISAIISIFAIKTCNRTSIKTCNNTAVNTCNAASAYTCIGTSDKT
nr:MAG TPA: hypothetical protein [Caudoviricetes sp.]